MKNKFVENTDGTVTIVLTQGKVAVIDAADVLCVSQHRWFAVKGNGRRSPVYYAATKMNHRTVFIHRLLFSCRQDIDHINGDGLDNRRCNIRVCSNAENSRNKRHFDGGTSRYKGVSWDKRSHVWHALIKVNYRSISLGRFSCEADGARAYDTAAREMFGEFARCNFGIDDGGNGANGAT